LPGFKIDSLQDSVVELRVKYDDYQVPTEETICGINNTYNAARKCIVNFTIPRDITDSQLLLVHYELTNFHQNHRDYFKSRDQFQLAGKPPSTQTKIMREQCSPLVQLGNTTINPCGLTANTFFNDIFTLVNNPTDIGGVPLELEETGIAWSSDLEYVFRQPYGFRSEECPPNTDCTSTECCDATFIARDGTNQSWSCTTPYVDLKQDPSGDTCFRYFYPNEDTTQYLYETYPRIINPIEGVTNEHFVVWMRVASQPTFRKFYGYFWLDRPVKAGTVFQFEIEANYAVQRFKGTKSLILSTNNIFGGKNPYSGPVFYGVGIFCLIAATFFLLKQCLAPRKLADPDWLKHKDD
jgi:LEM3 (ligand-effect modulator 3) family / CDC50 family